MLSYNGKIIKINPKSVNLKNIISNIFSFFNTFILNRIQHSQNNSKTLRYFQSQRQIPIIQLFRILFSVNFLFYTIPSFFVIYTLHITTFRVSNVLSTYICLIQSCSPYVGTYQIKSIHIYYFSPKISKDLSGHIDRARKLIWDVSANRSRPHPKLAID